MADTYTEELAKRLLDQSKWSATPIRGGFISLAHRVNREVLTDSISGKIAHIFIQHQILHEITKELIQLSNLYLQGEIWPVVFEPAYDGGEEMMTGWYLNYYKNHCIGCKNKDKYIEQTKRANTIRNKVAHKLSDKNEAIIINSYQEFERCFKKAETYYIDCQEHILTLLIDLNKRVDFTDFLASR